MVSTGTETAQATVLGPGFDSQQVHDYDLCDIYKPLYSPCATTSLLLLRPYSRKIANVSPVT
jgi:hypothetical protein